MSVLPIPGQALVRIITLAVSVATAVLLLATSLLPG